MILEGNISIPYKWTTGPTVGRFLTELRDNARIMGGRCDQCGKVYAPPPDVCGECYEPLSGWVELTGEGTVMAASTVHKQMPWSPLTPPYNLAMIRLDGADTALIHLTEGTVFPGDRVRAKFKDKRAGSLLDIEGFILTDGEQNISGGVNMEFQGKELTEVGKVFQALPARFRKGKVTKTTVYYFSIEDEKWTVTVNPEHCKVEPGKTIDDADCFLKTSKEILFGTFRGDYTPSLTDLLTGKIKTNNPQLLLTFKEIFGD